MLRESQCCYGTKNEANASRTVPRFLRERERFLKLRMQDQFCFHLSRLYRDTNLCTVYGPCYYGLFGAWDLVNSIMD